MKRHVVIAALLSGVGVLGLIFTLTANHSVRDYVAGHYRFVGKERARGNAKDTLIYASSKPVTATVKEIADARKPADRRTTEAGSFLRYRNDIVAVLPQGSGSRIMVDDEDDGYRHHYAYLGGWWGSYSGPAGAFRGGGPGSGK